MKLSIKKVVRSIKEDSNSMGAMAAGGVSGANKTQQNPLGLGQATPPAMPDGSGASNKVKPFDKNNILEYPRKNIVVTLFDKEKKIRIAPMEKEKGAKIRSLVNLLKNNSDVSSVKIQKNETFDVILSPTQKFYEVVNLIKGNLSE